MASYVYVKINFQKYIFQTFLIVFCLILHTCGSVANNEFDSIKSNPTDEGDQHHRTSTTTNPCEVRHPINCNSFMRENWDSFYLMFVVGIGITIAFCLCAGFLTCLLYFFCNKNRTPNRGGIVHRNETNAETVKPPPDFEEALKCSKVEYKIDIEETPPPVYDSLNI